MDMQPLSKFHERGYIIHGGTQCYPFSDSNSGENTAPAGHLEGSMTFDLVLIMTFEIYTFPVHSFDTLLICKHGRLLGTHTCLHTVFWVFFQQWRSMSIYMCPDTRFHGNGTHKHQLSCCPGCFLMFWYHMVGISI